MAITKTKFINYTRCPYYYHLDNKDSKLLNTKVSLNEYFDEEYRFNSEIMDEQLEVMLPYYKKVEEIAALLAPSYFDGNFSFAYNTLDQEYFECRINGNLYQCYVDIYNETPSETINIIEVKSTTSDKFLDTSYFQKNNKGIYYLSEINDMVKNKLLNRYDSCGRYIYDIAIQRYIIEKDLNKNGLNDLVNTTKYFLAVLNSDYVFDGIYINNEPIYNKDKFGNDIIIFIDVTDITKLYLPIIDEERKKLEKIINKSCDDIKVGNYCEYKKTTECKHKNFCFRNLPEKNSVFCYLDNHCGFSDEKGNKISIYDLINNKKHGMLDVPIEYLKREKNIIQRNVVEQNTTYCNYNKIKSGLELIKYPIYHFDFETFPCPLPRFKGEKCYTQSVFQFSLHIEDEFGCDKEKSHYGYLSKTNNDERKELVKYLCSLINEEGTVLVYNSSFEKNRLRELATIFPEYKEKLDFINNMVFDLLDIIKSNKKLYVDLGYTESESSLFNYYHPEMNGSFSIKKVLPLFSDLSYQQLDISNGVDALVTYSKFSTMNKDEYDNAYKSLIEYCKQDTWAMVEILRGLQSLSKNVKL